MAKIELALRGIDLKDLTDRQRAFVFEYVKDYNAKRACLAVGYKNSSMGKKLTDNKYYPKVVRAIGSIQRKNVEQAILTKDEILAELSNLATRDIIEMCDEKGVFITNDMRKVPAHIRRCIDGLEINQRFNEDGEVVGQHVKFKLVGKMGAIDMLMKHFGMFAPEKLEVVSAPNWDDLYEQEHENDIDIIEGQIASAAKPIKKAKKK